MSVVVDHLVLSAPSLDEGISHVESLTGVVAAHGGAHPGMGTHNALLALGEGELPEAKLVASRDTPGQAQAREELALNPPRSPHHIFPVPIREDLVVYLQNVPLDLSQREARKICAVIQALAMPEED